MKHLLPLLLLFSGAARAQEDTVYLKDFTGILYTSKDTVFYKLDSAKKYDKAVLRNSDTCKCPIMIKTIISGGLMGRDTSLYRKLFDSLAQNTSGFIAHPYREWHKGDILYVGKADTIVWHEMNLQRCHIQIEKTLKSGIVIPVIIEGWVVLHDFDNSYYSFDKKHLLDKKKIWGYKLL